MKKILKISLGIAFLLIGIIGALIPIFQGWMFGIPGLIILANYSPKIKKLLRWGMLKSGFNKTDK